MKVGTDHGVIPPAVNFYHGVEPVVDLAVVLAVARNRPSIEHASIALEDGEAWWRASGRSHGSKKNSKLAVAVELLRKLATNEQTYLLLHA